MPVTSYTELFSGQDWARLKDESALPPRQADVLRCVLRGMADKQIAVTTGMSVCTVRSHLRRMFDKFGSNDRVELILCMFGYLRKYRQEDGSGPASGALAHARGHPRTRKRSGQN
jgi:DNA-binding CsgD family transcriptional regulator